MSDEWFKKERDEHSVLAYLYRLFNDGSRDASAIEGLVAMTLKSFEINYANFRATLTAHKNNAGELQHDFVSLDEGAGRAKDAAYRAEKIIEIYETNEAAGRDKRVPIDEIRNLEEYESSMLGSALGIGFAFIEFGLTSNAFRDLLKNPQFADLVKGYFRKMGNSFRKINQKAKQDNIGKRITVIAMKNADSIDEGQKFFILNIAQIFSP